MRGVREGSSGIPLHHTHMATVGLLRITAHADMYLLGCSYMSLSPRANPSDLKWINDIPMKQVWPRCCRVAISAVLEPDS